MQPRHLLPPSYVLAKTNGKVVADSSAFATSESSKLDPDLADYRGKLLVLKHRYYTPPEVGSFDHYWLVSPSGDVGDDCGRNSNRRSMAYTVLMHEWWLFLTSLKGAIYAIPRRSAEPVSKDPRAVWTGVSRSIESAKSASGVHSCRFQMAIPTSSLR